MKGKGFVILVVILILLGLGGYFVMSGRNAAPGKNMMESMMGGESSGGLNSLKGLFTAGVPQTCTFSGGEGDSQNSGKVYMTKGKMRGDFATELNGKEVASHMIVDGETTYIWTDGEDKGYKTTFSAEKEAEAQAMGKDDGEAMKGSVDLDAMVDYDCTPWLPDASMFSLPSGVEFLSLEEMMEGMMEGMMGETEMKDAMSAQCSACDSLEGEAKTSCLAALNCN